VAKINPQFLWHVASFMPHHTAHGGHKASSLFIYSYLSELDFLRNGDDKNLMNLLRIIRNWPQTDNVGDCRNKD